MTSEHRDGTIRGERGTAPGIPIGTMLGSYQIEAQLGEGGMGVVYRATDTKLNRPVAIKFLADNLFDANARRRFQREAQMASSLNHPHILAVYDVGEFGDRQYLVTELVDGGTLQDWADAEPHRWRQVVELMVGVADALAAAHAASILHRDIKPTNILISQNGYAKLADFGLAKLVDDPDPAHRRSGGRHTATGAIVGTAAYMSPEQALGRPLDARSDIFTFGVLLYELLARRHPFAGETDVVMLQSVIHAPAAPLPDDIPEALKMVVDKAIEKEPADRYQSMRDLVVDLRRIARKSSASLPKVQPAPRRRTWAWVAWAIAGGAMAALLAVGLAALRRAPVALAESSEFVILPPEGTAFSSAQGDVAISPDGRQLAFVAVSSDGPTRLWVRSLGSLNARPLADTDDAVSPFWSPDSKSLGFFAGGKLRRVDAAGGPVQVLADTSLPQGGTWGRAGAIVYAPAPGGPLLSIPAGGGTPTAVTRYESGVLAHSGPFFLPDGRRFLYLSAGTVADSRVAVASLDSADATPLLTGRVAALYARPGYLLFLRAATLMAQPFDEARLALSGEAVPIASGISGLTHVAVSDNGTLVYRPGGVALTQLLWVDRSGRAAGVAAPAESYRHIALSADGTRVAFDRAGSATTQDVWILDLQRGITSRLTFAASFSNVPLWSPDGRSVAFAYGRNGGIDIYRRASNFSGSDEPVVELHASAIMFPSDWSADGRYLTYYRTTPQGRLDEWVLPTDGGEPIALLHEPFSESQAQFSPDGRWIAYVSDESGIPQIYVQSFPELSGKWQVSNAGGTQPRWAHDGTELYYLALDRKLMAAAVTARDTFEVRGSEALFATTLDLTDQRQTYAVAPDGRFLLNVPVATSAPLTIVLNWPALLKK